MDVETKPEKLPVIVDKRPSAVAKAKKPTGRPTLYKQEYDEQVVAFMAEGYSQTAFAGKIGVTADAVSGWKQRYPGFADAVKRGEAARNYALEQRLFSAKLPVQLSGAVFALKQVGWSDREGDRAAAIVQVNISKSDAKL